MINNYRVKANKVSLEWNQTIQDETRMRAFNMLREGVLSEPTFESPYVAQFVYADKKLSGETPDAIAQKIFHSWLTNEEQRQTILNTEITSMAVGYVLEAREATYYIVVLFTA